MAIKEDFKTALDDRLVERSISQATMQTAVESKHDYLLGQIETAPNTTAEHNIQALVWLTDVKPTLDDITATITALFLANRHEEVFNIIERSGLVISNADANRIYKKLIDDKNIEMFKNYLQVIKELPDDDTLDALITYVQT